jgi:Ohr subfamily peroxiredoxin
MPAPNLGGGRILRSRIGGRHRVARADRRHKETNMAFTATATTVGGRNGHVETSDGLIKLDLSVPKAIGGPGKPNTSNPEELFAAGYSACFGGAVEFAAHLEKVKIGPVTATADVTIDQNAGGFFLAVKMKVKVEGTDHATAEKLVHKAHNDICPYSKATRNNITVDLEIL